MQLHLPVGEEGSSTAVGTKVDLYTNNSEAYQQATSLADNGGHG